jgi:O-antigen/teichoic acid export membrane protein
MVGRSEEREPLASGQLPVAAPWTTSVSKRFRRGISWATVGTVIGFPATLAVSAMVARLLEPEAVGRYFAIISFVMVGSVVTGFGLPQIALRDVSRAVGLGEPQRAQDALRLCRRVVGTAGLVTAMSLMLADVVGLATPLTGASSQPMLAMAVGLILVAKAFLLLETSALRGLHDYSYSSILSKAAPHAFTAVLLGSLAVGGATVNLTGVIWATLVAVVLSMAISRWRWWRGLRGHVADRRARSRGAAGGVRPLLHESMPVWGFAVLKYALSENVDLLILAAFRPLEEVAVYGAASRLAQLVGGPVLVFNTASSPLIAELYATDDQARLEKVTRTSATLGSVPVAAGSLIALVFGGQLLALVFGDIYRTGATVFFILCLGKLVSVAFGQGGATLMMTGHQHRLVRMTAVSAGFYFVSALIATVVWGAVALALTSLAALALQNVGNWALARRHVGVATHLDLGIAVSLARRPFGALRR